MFEPKKYVKLKMMLIARNVDNILTQKTYFFIFVEENLKTIISQSAKYHDWLQDILLK